MVVQIANLSDEVKTMFAIQPHHRVIITLKNSVAEPGPFWPAPAPVRAVEIPPAVAAQTIFIICLKSFI